MVPLMGTERRPQERLCPDINNQAVVSCYLFSIPIHGSYTISVGCAGVILNVNVLNKVLKGKNPTMTS
jgi:hypothetical protein